jgi:hypothetical protein
MGTTASRADRAVPLLWASLGSPPPGSCSSGWPACPPRDRRTIRLRARRRRSLPPHSPPWPPRPQTATPPTPPATCRRARHRRPYLLGSLAGHLGLHAAFTIVPVLIRACTILLPAGLRLAQRPSSGSSPQECQRLTSETGFSARAVPGVGKAESLADTGSLPPVPPPRHGRPAAARDTSGGQQHPVACLKSAHPGRRLAG